MPKVKKRLMAAIIVCFATFVCFAGCASIDVTYNSGTNVVYNIFPQKLSCMGMVEISRHRGYQPFSPEGPYWISNEVFGIYFKNGPSHPSDFYLTIYSDNARSVNSTSLVEAVGSVQLLPNDYVLIDVKYRDAEGRWVAPFINGRRKIDQVLPEGRRK
jgi:hypothetical protein